MTLEIRQLSHRYGDVPALRNLSVQATSGAITAVLGPNAAGKSTLLRCIIGAIRPISGAVYIGGSAVHTMSPYHLAQRLAYVPQRSLVAAAFTVREVIELGRYALPMNMSAVDEAIERLDLKDIQHRPYPALSVGQQQRVTLARALAQLGSTQAGQLQQKLLILDEPTSAMDLRHVHEVMRLLHELTNAGVTILMAIHDLSLAAAVAQDAWLLNDGELVAAGSICEVLQIERLRAVYGVDFAWIDGPHGKPTLIASQPGMQ